MTENRPGGGVLWRAKGEEHPKLPFITCPKMATVTQMNVYSLPDILFIICFLEVMHCMCSRQCVLRHVFHHHETDEIKLEQTH